MIKNDKEGSEESVDDVAGHSNRKSMKNVLTVYHNMQQKNRFTNKHLNRIKKLTGYSHLSWIGQVI